MNKAINFLTDREKAIMNQIVDLIRNNITTPNYKADSISEHLGLSKDMVLRIVKRSTDITPNELIVRMRMEEAEKMLHTEKYKLSEIASRFGYNDYSVFSKHFSNVFKMSPIDYSTGIY